jgi:hypothetical protein
MVGWGGEGTTCDDMEESIISYFSLAATGMRRFDDLTSVPV